MGARTDRPDYDWADGVTLRLVELADGHRSEVVVPSSAGGGVVSARFSVERTGARVEVRRVGSDERRPWAVEVGGDRVEAAADVEVLVVEVTGHVA